MARPSSSSSKVVGAVEDEDFAFGVSDEDDRVSFFGDCRDLFSVGS